MGLYERLTGIDIGIGEAKLAVHAFMAAMGEIERGKMTAQQVVDAFGLSGAEATEAATLAAKIVSPLESISFGGFATLTNIGNTFDATNGPTGLGFAPIETNGITAFEFRVGMNRNGASGTIEWQMWNQTDGSQIALLQDTAGAGNKFVETTVNLASPLGPGVKVVRIRGRSTTATDDPIYLGASLAIRRVSKMTSEVLHELLLMAESRVAPYDTVSALMTRLGV